MEGPRRGANHEVRSQHGVGRKYQVICFDEGEANRADSFFRRSARYYARSTVHDICQIDIGEEAYRPHRIGCQGGRSCWREVKGFAKSGPTDTHYITEKNGTKT